MPTKRERCRARIGRVDSPSIHWRNADAATYATDSATVTACLVPWNSGGAYQAATLGVATIAYLPFAFFNWLSPVVTLVFGWFGWTIHPIDEVPADREPESRAAVLAGRRRIRLGERREERFLLLFCETDSRIPHTES